jgi:hypothetical protein
VHIGTSNFIFLLPAHDRHYHHRANQDGESVSGLSMLVSGLVDALKARYKIVKKSKMGRGSFCGSTGTMLGLMNVRYWATPSCGHGWTTRYTMECAVAAGSIARAEDFDGIKQVTHCNRAAIIQLATSTAHLLLSPALRELEVLRALGSVEWCPYRENRIVFGVAAGVPVVVRGVAAKRQPSLLQKYTWSSCSSFLSWQEVLG